MADPDRSDSTPARRRKKRENDNLYFDERRDVWYWRKVHPTSKKRLVVNTGQRRKDLAQREAARLEDELAQELAGVKRVEPWRGELVPLVGDWIESLANSDVPPSEATRAQKKRETLRALNELRLRLAADLTHVGRIDDRLRKLGISKLKMRRCYQEPLKQFSKWLAAYGRHIPEDPLRTWPPIRVPREERREPRCAFLPLDVARALAALDVLDAKLKRAGSSRLLFTAFLVTAPRAEAMVTRDVVHLDPKRALIQFGLAVGNKVRGAGALDPKTAATIEAATKGRRAHDPLFLSPEGTRWPKERVLDVWRQGFSLGVVADLWPRDEAPSLDNAILVSRALLTGHVRVSKGGNPNLEPTTDEGRARAQARLDLEVRIARLVDRLQADWRARVDGVDVHSFRMTLQTWCEASGVPAAIIDRQLGHAAPNDGRGLEVLKAIAGSRTGRKHYLDLGSQLIDPARAAVAMRELLDQAEADLHAAGSLLLPAATTAATRTDQAATG